MALLVGYSLCRGLLLAGIVPPWQGPDEPGHDEYAWLLAPGDGSVARPDPSFERAGMT